MPRDGLVSYRDYQFDDGLNRFIYDRLALISNDLWFSDASGYGEPLWFVQVLDTLQEFWATSILVYCHRCERRLPSLSNGQVVKLINGVIRMLEFASEHGYDRLRALTYSKVTHDLAPLISPALCSETIDPDVEEALSGLQAAISDNGGVRNLARVIIRNGEREAAKIEVARAEDEVQQTKRELEVALHDLAVAKRDAENDRRRLETEMADEIARIKSSRTWKVGKIVWWGPRKIRDFMESR